ncbi:uncharacterized protein LOC142345000 [Convolutriloba macropyga]|uniref:uncharacterized protein LOC142345000 n=1 Tax=Convolutriloba macropyga TaxID=536237 RepID=UPI003F5258ED
MAKIPLSGFTVTSYNSLTETKCEQRMIRFKWDIGLYCPSSHFCGMGIDLNKTYGFESSTEFTPLQEVCHLLVNNHLTNCEETKENLFSVGILKRSPWSCQSHGAIYCADKFLTLCMDVEAGAMCTGCLQGAQAEQEGRETLCIDIDECKLPENVCGLKATACENEILSYNCECDQGFQFDGKYGSQCTDIDECSGSSNGYCGTVGVCSNTVGGYECYCRTGFYFNKTDYGSGCQVEAFVLNSAVRRYEP